MVYLGVVTKFSDERGLRLFNTISPAEAGIPPALTTEEVTGPGLEGHELSRFWAGVFERDQLTLSSSHDARMLAAWRIVRFLGVLRGALQPTDGIAAAMDGPDVFYRPFTAFAEFNDGYVRALLEECQLPLLPPAIPARWIGAEGVDEDYAPEIDRPLELFRSMVEHAGIKLGLPQSDAARNGFVWFVHVDSIRAAFPTLEELLRFERKLASDAMLHMTEDSYQKAFTTMRAELDLNDDETMTVMRLGREQAHNFVDPDDLRGIRALVLLRLQKLGAQAEDALDHRGAAMIEREMWRVARDQGTQAEVDEMEDMAAVVKVHAAAKRKRLGS